MSTTPIADRTEVLAEMREQTLRDISRTTSDLDRAFRTIESDAASSREAMRLGQSLMRTVTGYQPLDRQSLEDVARLTSRLDTLLRQAQMLGCTEDQIATAYTVA